MNDVPYPDVYFSRQDESDDALFYASARKVVHMDDAAIALQKAIPIAKAKAKPGTPEFRAALRDAFETMGRTVFAHGVMNWTPTDHWGYTKETGVMLKVSGGQFVVEK